MSSHNPSFRGDNKADDNSSKSKAIG